MDVAIGAVSPISLEAWFMIWPTVIELRCSSSSGRLSGRTASSGNSARSAARRRSSSRVSTPPVPSVPEAVSDGADVAPAGASTVRATEKSPAGADSAELARNFSGRPGSSGRVNRSWNSASWLTGAPSAYPAPTALSRPDSDRLSVSNEIVGTCGAISLANPRSTLPGPTSSSRSQFSASRLTA